MSMAENPEKQMRRPLLAVSLLALSGLIITACSSTESAAPKSSAEVKPVVTGAPEVQRINARGGNKIAVLVNGEPITTNAIKRRSAFRRLRGEKSTGTAASRKELVDETLKLQEAKRVRASASKAEVESAYGGFVSRNKMTRKQFAQILNRSGVGVKEFKDYIKAQISWQRTVSIRVQRDAAGVGTTRRANFQRWLPSDNTGTAKEQEYTIQQIVFTVPSNKRSSQMAGRRAQAKNFRNQIDGCENARTLAAGQRNVAVLDRGRFLESRLPAQWAKEIKVTAPGKVTRVRDTEKGVEMIVVCRKREVIGNQSVDQAKLFQGNNFSQSASKTEKTYLEELRKKAVIQTR